ncbi:MAG: bifunctional demethylmenaquinone methyltransferase/2-methoxy-6-polyprenyl-1,4-benzoquinol methylase UbiE [Hyphomicrobiaceae bacterium]|nr:bifunctional demethylmenaquinone methyltransferase/2-methoxy-6-polyprenyl-1,4-benzoquinol methylase UbiE [Hyphomicrobiaceae bacterium]
MTDPTHQPADHPNEDAKTSFGYREVSRAARQGLVNEVFSSVAGRYDLMNDLMSGGLHRLWKSDLIGWLAPPRTGSGRPYRLLDVAGGTADVALRFANATGPEATAVVCDISPEMLEVGARKVADAGLAERITLIEGNAERLPFDDRSFDAYTIAFGIRNVTDVPAALREAHRVLKIGGRFLCLEFSHVQVPVLDRLYDLHSFEVIPRLGDAVAGDGDSYRYLVESIRRFPDQEAFAALVREAGFANVSYRNLTGGIAALHSGWRV